MGYSINYNVNNFNKKNPEKIQETTNSENVVDTVIQLIDKFLANKTPEELRTINDLVTSELTMKDGSENATLEEVRQLADDVLSNKTLKERMELAAGLKSQMRNDMISLAVLEVIPELKDAIIANDKHTVIDYLFKNNYNIGFFGKLDNRFFSIPVLGCIFKDDLPIHFFDFF